MKRAIIIALFMGSFMSVVPEKEIKAVTCDYRDVQVCGGILNSCLKFVVKYREDEPLFYGEILNVCENSYRYCMVTACPSRA